MDFTQRQQETIKSVDQNLKIIACAGSGKTEVVAQGVATLLKNGLAPCNIVAFTFTGKAAAELKERIITRWRERAAMPTVRGALACVRDSMIGSDLLFLTILD